MMPGVLALKLLLVPSLIVAVTLAGRRWGATVAGCLAGFPVVTGPILLFLALEQGIGFTRQAAIAAILAVLANIAFGITYSWASKRYSWLISLAIGLFSFFAMVVLLNMLVLTAGQATVLTMGGLLLASTLYPDDTPEENLIRATARSDLPYRILASLGLVLAVTLFSVELGPNLSGMLAVFPVMGSVLGVFSHRNIGQGFAVRLLKGMVQGFYAFTVFCFILASSLAWLPAVGSFVLAFVAAILLQAILMHMQVKK